MKKQITTLVLALTTGIVMGQQTGNETYSSTETKTTTTEETSEIFGSRSYIGASGGYLFQNKKVGDDPMYYIKDGRFAELNFGARGNLFGWSGALGYLEMKRNPSKFENIYLNSQMLYDSSTGGTKPANVLSGLDQNTLFLSPDHEISEYKDFKGFYFLTGPNVWFDFNKLSVNVAVEGGVGYSQPGYYFVKGFAKQADGSLPINVEGSTRDETQYDIDAMAVNYLQYGASQKYFDKVNNSTLSNPFDEKQDREFHFMGRATANAEYFITPKISIHAGVNYWYIKPPKMNGAQQVNIEIATYTSADKGSVDFNHPSRYTDTYSTNDMKFFSGNAGLKFWFGGSKKSTKTTTTTVQNNTIEKPQIPEVEQEAPKTAKSVMVTVVDKLTKTPMGDVAVVLNGKNGLGDIHATTQSNGTVELHDVAPGDYDLNGQVYNIATSSNQITSSEFEGNNAVIYKTLEYNDPRFILKGVTVNSSTGDLESDVKVSLEKGAQKVSETVTKTEGDFNFLLQSNSDYQIQGLKNGLYSNTESVTTKGLNRSQTLYVTLKIGMDEVAVGKSFVINNILYDFDDAAIRPDAALELDRLANFLNENPDVRIELSSHTDSRGSDAYNLKLSQRRAQSAVNYLINKGISKSRLVAKGYGETRLVNGCANGVPCSDEEHQANRRTEIEIIK